MANRKISFDGTNPDSSAPEDVIKAATPRGAGVSWTEAFQQRARAALAGETGGAGSDRVSTADGAHQPISKARPEPSLNRSRSREALWKATGATPPKTLGYNEADRTSNSFSEQPFDAVNRPGANDPTGGGFGPMPGDYSVPTFASEPDPENHVAQALARVTKLVEAFQKLHGRWPEASDQDFWKVFAEAIGPDGAAAMKESLQQALQVGPAVVQ